MYLEEIIADIKLENDKFECKARLNRNDIVGWLKTSIKSKNAQYDILTSDKIYTKQATLRI